MNTLSTLNDKQAAPSLSAKEEALAVLMEMERLAEQRLIEASSEFQDIAHEMEWRLHDWMRLTDERKKLEVQLERAQCATPRFNLRARALDHGEGEAAKPRKDKWAKMVAVLCARLERNVAASEETLEAITARNEEGEALQREIFALQEKIQRIGRNLRQMQKSSALVVREGDAAAALARLDVLFSGGRGDVPDPATLISAACAVGRGIVAMENRGAGD